MLTVSFPHCSSKSGRRALYVLTSLEAEMTRRLERARVLADMLTSALYR